MKKFLFSAAWLSLFLTVNALTAGDTSKKDTLHVAGADIPVKQAEKEVNYVIPIVGGAILGIGLAIWLRRKK